MSSTLDSYVNQSDPMTTPDGRQIRIDDLVELYRELSKTSAPISGQLINGENERQKSLRIVCGFRDMDRMERTKFVTNYSIKLSKDCTEVKNITSIGQPIDVTNDLATALTGNGSKYMAVVRKGAKDPESGKTKQWLEIWDKTTKIKSIDVSSLEEHKDIALDSQFGDFLWSPDGKKLVYVADYKPPKAVSYFKKQTKKSENSDTNSDTRGQEFVHRDDWGETLDGISHTVIAILDIESEFKIRTIELKDYSLSQPFWIGNGEAVGYIGWDEKPRRLGIIGCRNRLSSIFMSDLSDEKSAPKLVYGVPNTTVRNPRRCCDGKGFVFLENESAGTHNKAIRLMLYNIKSQSVEILFDKKGIREIITDGNGVKYGKLSTLFVDQLTENCFTSDGKHLLINCLTEFQFALYLLNIQTKDLKRIVFPLESIQMFDIKDDIIIAVGSSVNIKPNIFVGKLNANESETIKWTEIPINSSDSLRDISYENYWIPSEDPNKLLTAILITPKSVNHSVPTVVMLHGGPHHLDLNIYSIYSTIFAKLGLKVLQINYRGSLGVDEDYVNALIGNVGEMDVKDVIQCIKHLSDKCVINSSKLVLWGASHGGFLVTHLSGQYAHMDFKSCIAINPVIDLSTKPDGTDIPDWGSVESFGISKQFCLNSALDPDSLREMFQKSPINWVNSVKVPTLMLLGKGDRRVPMSQGLKYYRILEARGVKTRCYIYDDCHGLAKIDVMTDEIINTCLWILQHLD